MLKSIALTSIFLLALLPLGVSQNQSAPSPQGIDEVEVIKTTATIEKVDLEKRKVTLILEDGKKKTYKVDPSVRNLDQVKSGDHLSLSYTEELVVMVGKSADAPMAASMSGVSVAPKGAKPGAVMVDTVAESGTILKIDGEKRKVTVEEAGGKKKTIKVSKSVDLGQLKVGDTVNAVLTESLVINVVK